MASSDGTATSSASPSLPHEARPKHPTQVSFPKTKIKILLLENIAQSAVQMFDDQTYQIECIPRALQGDELAHKLIDVHAVCIRSTTQITAASLAHANRLLAIGCFCIGTNQVDLDACAARGIAVFNSPFCNTRSVAELIVSMVIALARKLGDKNRELHCGVWDKSASNCHEIRGKTLGIVGYGHIGTQLSILAEALGMRVIYKDISVKMPYSNSRQVFSLDELLETADFVSMHVPETPETVGMIGANEFAKMKRGAYFLNASRGTVADLDALALAIKSGHIGGAYVDVYPVEPKAKSSEFQCPLLGLPNVILSPHIGGSTEEAQWAIGSDVASKIIDYINVGLTIGAVNFPELTLPYFPDTHRICNVHHNRPGALRDINNIVGDSKANIISQVLGTRGSIGYLILEVDQELSQQIKESIAQLPISIKTRIMF
jgi:D-3-phosphoglycerate dehydrogenase / 2-oxoglutarate reductase